jgi:hypothetical protein
MVSSTISRGEKSRRSSAKAPSSTGSLCAIFSVKPSAAFCAGVKAPLSVQCSS